MKTATAGAWIIHHSNKLTGVTNAGSEFEQIQFAGRCGVLLSSISASHQSSLDNTKLEALAKSAGINTKLELPAIIAELERQKLIDKNSAGIEVLGLTTAKTLEHTSTIFTEAKPTTVEHAAIYLAEHVSDIPTTAESAQQLIGDTFKISTDDAKDFFFSAEQIGFVDFESVDATKKLYFNGNLFRRGDAKKNIAIIQSLSSADQIIFNTFNEELSKAGCVPLAHAEKVLGAALFKKLQSIGAYDVNVVGNEKGHHSFVTRPAAFKKFSEAAIDDAFDLAKAFVSSLTYGMTSRAQSQGRISMIQALMRKLISGGWVGPATAIGFDYKVLETRGVVQVRVEKNGLFSMRLLKPEVGEIALQVILEGEASSQSIAQLPGASVTTYAPPEKTRSVVRKNQTEPMKREVGVLLHQLRTGGL